MPGASRLEQARAGLNEVQFPKELQPGESLETIQENILGPQ